jgi:hypothetical protein
MIMKLDFVNIDANLILKILTVGTTKTRKLLLIKFAMVPDPLVTRCKPAIRTYKVKFTILIKYAQRLVEF